MYIRTRIKNVFVRVVDSLRIGRLATQFNRPRSNKLTKRTPLYAPIGGTHLRERKVVHAESPPKKKGYIQNKRNGQNYTYVRIQNAPCFTNSRGDKRGKKKNSKLCANGRHSTPVGLAAPIAAHKPHALHVFLTPFALFPVRLFFFTFFQNKCHNRGGAKIHVYHKI